MASSAIYLMDLPTEVITKICEKLFTGSETGQITYYPFFEPRHSVFQLVNKSSQALRCCSQLQAIGTPILYGSNTFAIRPPDTGQQLCASKAGSIQRLSVKESLSYEWRRIFAQCHDLRFLEIVLDLRCGEDLPWPCKISQEQRHNGVWKHAFLRADFLRGRTTPSDLIKEGSSLAKRRVEVVISGHEVESAQRNEILSWSTYTSNPRRVSCQSRAQTDSY